MTKASTFVLKQAWRGDRPYMDILVDDRPLRHLLLGRPDVYPNHVSPIGWGSDEIQHLTIARLLLEAAADFPDDRRAILVCVECGGLGCGAYSARIHREGDIVVWSDFGYENDLGLEPVDRSCGQALQRIAFSWPEYERELRIHQGAQRAHT